MLKLGVITALISAGIVLLFVLYKVDVRNSWVQAQRERCYAVHGRGSFTEGLFECFEASPFTLKVEFNKPVGFQRPEPKKLFEARYLYE